MSGQHRQPVPRRRPGLPLTLGLVAVLVAPLAASASGAAWVDREHTNGTLTSLNCATTSGFVSAGQSRLVGGSALSVDLDSIVALAGATAVSPGSGSTVQSSNPLSVSALSAINADLGGALSLDLAASAGALRQFAEASPDGRSRAAAGTVSESGAITLSPATDSRNAPRFAELRLSDVLEAVTPGGGAPVAGLADVALVLGAIASFAELDGCAADWSESAWAALERDYLIAGLGAELTSPLVGDAAATVTEQLATVEGLVEAVAGNSGLLNSIGASALSALSSTLSGFLVGTPVVSLGLDVSLSSVLGAVGSVISDPSGIATVDLGSGTVWVDLARLLGPAYEDSVGLNGLAPNTELLLNAEVAGVLVDAVTAAVTAWLGTVSAAVSAAVDVVTVDLTVTVPISVAVAAIPILLPSGIVVPVGNVIVRADHVALNALDAGTAPIAVTLALTPPSCSGVVNAAICGVVNPLLSGLTTAVTGLVLNGVLGPVVADLISALLNPVPGLSTLVSTVGAALGSVVTMLSGSLDGLFGPDALLSLVVNAQNAPDPAELSSPPGIEPPWVLAAPADSPYRTGQYSVAALRLVVAGGLGGGLAVDLARSTVGSNGR